MSHVACWYLSFPGSLHNPGNTCSQHTFGCILPSIIPRNESQFLGILTKFVGTLHIALCLVPCISFLVIEFPGMTITILGILPRIQRTSVTILGTHAKYNQSSNLVLKLVPRIGRIPGNSAYTPGNMVPKRYLFNHTLKIVPRIRTRWRQFLGIAAHSRELTSHSWE